MPHGSAGILQWNQAQWDFPRSPVYADLRLYIENAQGVEKVHGIREDGKSMEIAVLCLLEGAAASLADSELEKVFRMYL